MKTIYISIAENCLEELRKQLISVSNLEKSFFRPLIIADNNTWTAFGKRVYDCCKEMNLNPYESKIFSDRDLYADIDNVEIVQSCIVNSPDCIILAVGSGTINDICKLASFRCGKKYFVFATAPSVDGYTSCGAAINDNGVKKTIACDPPYAVFGCPSVLSQAPLLLLSSGYGDLIAKIPAGADWIIADELGIQPIEERSWNLLQPRLRQIISQPGKLMQRDMNTSAEIFKGLIDSGLAIQELGDSRPASGAEHLFSHVFEMFQHLEDWPYLTHGHKVALGSLVSTAFYEQFLSLTEEEIISSLYAHVPLSWAEKQDQIKRSLKNVILINEALKSSYTKFVNPEEFEARRELIKLHIHSIRDRVRQQCLSFDEIKHLLLLAQCPVSSSDAGLTIDQFTRIINCSSLIRSRFTILDLLEQCGLLASLTKKVVEMIC